MSSIDPHTRTTLLRLNARAWGIAMGLLLGLGRLIGAVYNAVARA